MLKNKLRLGLTTLILFCALNSTSQLGLKGILFSPTGDFGFAMKKTFGPELIWKKPFEESFRSRIYVNYAQFNSRLDTVRTAAYESSGSGSAVLPGYITYGKMWNLTLGIGYDYSPIFMEDWPVRPYIGFDLNVGAHHRATTFDTGVSNVSQDVSTIFGGVVGRIGVEANFDKIGIFFDASRNYNLVAEAPSFAYSSFGIGLIYYFD